MFLSLASLLSHLSPSLSLSLSLSLVISLRALSSLTDLGEPDLSPRMPSQHVSTGKAATAPTHTVAATAAPSMAWRGHTQRIRSHTPPHVVPQNPRAPQAHAVAADVVVPAPPAAQFGMQYDPFSFAVSVQCRSEVCVVQRFFDREAVRGVVV